MYTKKTKLGEEREVKLRKKKKIKKVKKKNLEKQDDPDNIHDNEAIPVEDVCEIEKKKVEPLKITLRGGQDANSHEVIK